jgi:hypothetical protein
VTVYFTPGIVAIGGVWMIAMLMSLLVAARWTNDAVVAEIARVWALASVTWFVLAYAIVNWVM